MKLWMQPAIRLMNLLRFRQKFLMLGALLAIPLVLLVVSYVLEVEHNLKFANRERRGIAVMRAIENVAQVQIRFALELSSETTGSDQGYKTSRLNEIGKLLTQLGTVARVKELGIDDSTRVLQSNWSTIRLDFLQSSRSEQLEALRQLDQDLANLRREVGDRSNLTLDPSVDSHYLMEVSVDLLPEMMSQAVWLADEHMSAVRSGLAELPSGHTMKWRQLQERMQRVDRGMGIAFRAQPAVAERLSSPKLAVGVQLSRNARTAQYLKSSELAQLLGTGPGTRAQVRGLARNYGSCLESLRVLRDRCLGELDLLLEQRIAGEVFRRNAALVATTSAMVLATYFVLALYLSLRELVRTAAEAARRMSQTEDVVTIPIVSRDELADLAKSFNHVCNQLRDSAAELTASNETLEQNVVERTRELEAQNALLTLAQQELAEHNKALEEALDGIIRLKPDGRVRQVNAACERIFGISPANMRDRYWSSLFSEASVISIEDCLEQTRSGERAECVVDSVGEHGLERRLSMVLVPIMKESGESAGHFMIMTDITERSILEHRVNHQAYHDPLTGLPNRYMMREQGARAMENVRSGTGAAAILCIDLDNFKSINDSVGMEDGDQLLREVSIRLQGAVKQSDLVARLAGDEFAVLLEDIRTSDDALAIAERLMSVFRHPFQLGGREFYVSASIGVAMIEAYHDRIEDTMKDANIAMNEAKAAGKNHLMMFDFAMLTRAMERVEIESGLRVGLEREEFELYYQPLVRLDDQSIIGAEALIRWNHAENGVISPAKFIPIAEETGLIVPIGLWIMEEACRELQRWDTMTVAPLTMSVNLSLRQMSEPNIVDELVAVAEKVGMDPGRIKLEITESVMATDTDVVLQKMTALRQAGFQLALDDFGTGYSSLSQIQNMPLDLIKIDRSFVNAMRENDPGPVVTSVVQMTRALGLKVVCEGIETETQLQMLDSMGCEYGQGYLFSRPVPAANFRDLLVKSSAIDLPKAA